jgi:hypothetical protein
MYSTIGAFVGKKGNSNVIKMRGTKIKFDMM